MSITSCSRKKPPDRMKLNTVLFDLDGTLLDTYRDMGAALNTLLAAYQKPMLPVETIRPFVSNGAMVMVCHAFQCEPDSEQATTLWKKYLDEYARNLCVQTGLFNGMERVLDEIESQGMKWGIVTNKPGFLTEPLLSRLSLDTKAGCVISGDTLPQRKPHPAPLQLACEQLGTQCHHAVYIGDDARDVQAGKSAGMRTIAAAYGYIASGDNPGAWQADHIIESPLEIIDWMNGLVTRP